MTSRPSTAVIGSGVAGLTAGYLLRRHHSVTLFEADDRLGGHAHTHDLELSDGPISVDSGFIVHNVETYPSLLRLFAALNIETVETEMSLAINCDQCGLNYAGGRGIAGLFAQRRRVFDLQYLKMLAEIPRFHRTALALLTAPEHVQPTWGEFLEQNDFSGYFVAHFAVPLVSCVWSCNDDDAMRYPARHLFAFLDNHRMLNVRERPEWRTVVGGSAKYVDAVAGHLDDVRTNTPVTAVRRFSDRVDVTAAGQTESFDNVIIATHADIAAEILLEQSVDEANSLRAFAYSKNTAVLHEDTTFLPSPRAWSSWNYQMESCTPSAPNVAVSYWMNRLQHLPSEHNIVVTLNPDREPEPHLVHQRMVYEHPVFTTEAVQAAERLKIAGGDRLAFAGAHLGWGFHEDGCRSGVEAAEKIGTVSW